MTEDTGDEEENEYGVIVGHFSIRAVDDDGEPISGAEVYCSYGVVGGSATEYTDDDGWTTFPIIKRTILMGNLLISRIIIGKEVVAEKLEPEDGDTFSYTVTEY